MSQIWLAQFRVESSIDHFEQGSASLAGMARGEIAAQFEHWNLGAGILKSLRRCGGSNLVGAHQQEIDWRDLHEKHGIADAIGSLDFVSGAPQEFAQIGEHVDVRVETEDAGSARSGCC